MNNEICMKKAHKFTKTQQQGLQYFSEYIWWEKPEYMIANEPFRIIAQAMRYANEEVEFLKIFEYFDEEILKETLKKAQAGWLDNESWNFWHLILYKTSKNTPPPPKREIKWN